MEQKFDIKQALRVYYKIVQHGQKVNDEHRLNDVWASADHDGYTVMLHDDAVTLHIFFHNTHKFTYKRAIQLEQFMTRLAELDRMQLNK